MILVAIDTSTDTSGIALWDDSGLLAQMQWQSGRRHSEQVLAQLDHLCRLCAIQPTAITRVAVSCGPGSWSGIRVGISIANGIAIANDIPLVAVNALDMLAWPWRGQQPISVARSLGRGRIALAHYPADHWQPATISAHNTPLSALPTITACCCDTHLWAQLAPQLAHTTYHPPLHATPALVAMIALQSADAQAPVEPIYLGEPVQPLTPG
jgi:tRNA threonylcarbamoyladenosine biosynthesis protein TsaB